MGSELSPRFSRANILMVGLTMDSFLNLVFFNPYSEDELLNGVTTLFPFFIDSYPIHSKQTSFSKKFISYFWVAFYSSVIALLVAAIFSLIYRVPRGLVRRLFMHEQDLKEFEENIRKYRRVLFLKHLAATSVTVVILLLTIFYMIVFCAYSSLYAVDWVQSTIVAMFYDTVPLELLPGKPISLISFNEYWVCGD
jgi:drug/metabolite transporter (DMT)-like permease